MILWISLIFIFCCVFVWAWITISQRITGGKHLLKAREFAIAGNWEQASLLYKQAIISHIDSGEKLFEIKQELSNLYKDKGFEVNLNQIFEFHSKLKNDD